MTDPATPAPAPTIYPFPPAWRPAVTAWVAYLRAGHRSPATIRIRCYHLSRLAADHPDPWAVTLGDLTGWLAAHDWSAETLRGHRVSFQGFWKHAVLTGATTRNPAAALPTVRVPPSPARACPEPVYHRALARAADQRVQLMLSLAWQQGLRRAEICQVHSRDLEQDLYGAWSLIVHGKGGRDRRVPLVPEVAAQLRALPAGWAFPGKIDGHLSARWVGKLMRKALVTSSAHPLRHGFAARVYVSSGRDLRTLQSLMGHSSLETTQRYLPVDERAKRRAVMAAAAWREPAAAQTPPGRGRLTLAADTA